MKFEMGDKVKIDKVIITSDTVGESSNYLNKIAYITEIINNTKCRGGVSGNYYTTYKSGYKLNIGNPNWVWQDEELILLNSYNKNKIESEINILKNRLNEIFQ